MLLNSKISRKNDSSILLALCYVYFPLANLLSGVLNLNFSRNTIDFALALVAVVAMLILLSRRHANISAISVLSLMVVISLFSWVFIGYIFDFSPLPTALMEVKPLIYLLIAVLINQSRLGPNVQDFCKYGSILSIILIIESLIRSASSGSLVRPIGSGEVNYDAALILLSLVFSLTNKQYFNRFAPLLLIGILASFSRTSLLVVCLILIVVNFIQMKYRLLIISLAIITGLSSFVIRGLELNSLESMDRYWMWMSGIDYIIKDFFLSAILFAPGSSLDINVPPYVEELWLNQQEAIGLDGIYPFHLHAFWLRLLVGWGWLPVLLLLFFFYREFRRKRAGIEVKAYIIACLILGLTMGLFYLSNVSVPYFIAGLMLFNKNSRLKNTFNQNEKTSNGNNFNFQ